MLSDLVYTRILEPASKRSSFHAAQKFLEPPSYELHDIYRALSVLSKECDLIQSEAYKNSLFAGKRNDRILYYDCTNYYFGIEQEEGDKKYGKSKEHRPNPIIQMGLFTDGDGIPLAFSLFPGNQNEQASLKPLEKTILQEFGCDRFIYCSDAGLGSENNREFNHMGKRAFIVTQSIKKLPAEDREWALAKTGFKRMSDDKGMDITSLSDKDKDFLFYKDEPYTTKKLHQRLIVTYSPKYAAYQKEIRQKQVERAEKMVKDGKLKKQRKNPNDPARFVGRTAVTKEGEAADIHYSMQSEVPAYEQIKTQIKAQILSGELAPDQPLTSMRQLVRDLRVSVITTTRAYGDLEAEELLYTVQGRGCFVKGDAGMIRRQYLHAIDEAFRTAVEKGKAAGLSLNELQTRLEESFYEQCD